MNGDSKDGLKPIYSGDIIELTEKERWALNTYISSKSYMINESLRENHKLSNEEIEFVKYFDSVLRKMPKYQGMVIRSLQFNRGELIKFAKTHKINAKTCYAAYTSASVKGSYHESPTVLLQIHSKTGRDIRRYNPDENEILFERNTCFRVLSVREENRMIVVEMEELLC